MKNETIKKLKKMKYKDYLQTDYWKMVSEQARIKAHNKCQLCGCSDKKLNVHHNTYEHIGEEFKHMEDLVCLCEDCHNYFHSKKQILDEKEKDEKVIDYLKKRLKETMDDLNYAEWKLKLYYASQKDHTSSEIEKMVESSIMESFAIQRSCDLPF